MSFPNITIDGNIYNTTRSYPGSSYNTTFHRWVMDQNDLLMLNKSTLRVAFCSAWLGLFIAVLLTFVFLSTTNQRRGPVFMIQCLSFTLALAYNLMDVVIYYIRTKATFNKPEVPLDWSNWNNAHLANVAFEHIIPLIADTAVLFKIRSFYPAPLHSSTRRFLVIAPLIALIFPRIALTIAGTYYVFREQTSLIWLNMHVYPVVLGFEWHERFQRTYQAEFALGAIYCAYAAAVLLIKAQQFSRRSAQIRRDSIHRRIRFFMEAMLMSFVPPMVFSIAAVGTLECPATKYCNYREMTGSLVNTSVLFSLLATSWSSIRASNDSNSKQERGWVGSSGRDESNKETISYMTQSTLPNALIHKLYGRGSKKPDDFSNSSTMRASTSNPNSTSKLRPRAQSGMYEHESDTLTRFEDEKSREKTVKNEQTINMNHFHFNESKNGIILPPKVTNIHHDNCPSGDLTFINPVSPEAQMNFSSSPPLPTASYMDHSAGMPRDKDNPDTAKTSKSFISLGGSGTDINEEMAWTAQEREAANAPPPPSLPWMRQDRS